MLNKQTFKNEMENLSLAFPKWETDIGNQKVLALWYSFFEKYDDYEFIDGVKSYIKNNRFSPTIASLNDEVKDVDPYKGLKRISE